MVLIKQKPEDFLVEEVPLYDPKEQGKYVYFWLTKKNWNTVQAVEYLKKYFGINKITFAGSKDRKAITKQLISFPSSEENKVTKLEFKEASISKSSEFGLHEKYIKLEKYGYGDEPISLGSLKGNIFTIKVSEKLLDEKIKKINPEFLNLFGEQRFSENNHIIGKYIFQRKFDKAVSLLIDQNNPEIKEHIEKYSNDYIGAIRKLHKKVLMLYLHAYQSYIWNETAIFFKKRSIKKDKIALVGFDTYDEISHELLTRDNLEERSFVMKEIPDATIEGEKRKMYEQAQNLERIDDHTIKFFLNKGTYATTFIEHIFSEKI